MFARSIEKGRIGVSAARNAVVLGMVSVIQAMDETSIDMLRGEDTKDSNGRYLFMSQRTLYTTYIELTISPYRRSPLFFAAVCKNKVQHF